MRNVQTLVSDEEHKKLVNISLDQGIALKDLLSVIITNFLKGEENNGNRNERNPEEVQTETP